MSTTAQSLSDWFKTRVNAFYAATDESALNIALDALFSSNASVQHNDDTIGVEENRRRMLAQTAASSRVDVKWERIEETAPVRIGCFHDEIAG